MTDNKYASWEELGKELGIETVILEKPVNVHLSNEILSDENWLILKQMLGITGDCMWVNIETNKITVKKNKNKEG